MKYAKYIDDRTVDLAVPKKARFDDTEYAGDLSRIPGLLESLGFFPLEEAEPPELEPGFHAEARFREDDGRIVKYWIPAKDVAPPARSLSKRKLYNVLKTAGIWAGVKSYMESAGVWEDWEYATTLDEDDPLITAAVSTIQAALGLTDEQVEDILSNSVVEDPA